jgi:hypothetical protein
MTNTCKAAICANGLYACHDTTLQQHVGHTTESDTLESYRRMHCTSVHMNQNCKARYIYYCCVATVVPSPTKPMFLRLFHSNSSSYLYGTEWTQQRTSELYNDELCFGHDVIDGLLADSGHRGLWSIDLH